MKFIFINSDLELEWVIRENIENQTLILENIFAFVLGYPVIPHPHPVKWKKQNKGGPNPLLSRGQFSIAMNLGENNIKAKCQK